MEQRTAEDRVLDAAGGLFYARGVHAVGMDDVRDASGVSLKRLYQLFPNKERLVTAYLQRRDVWWRDRLATHVAGEQDPRRRPLAVFDWLDGWFHEPDYRGCAWINCYGELGATSAPVAREARTHKESFRTFLRSLAVDAGLPAETGDHLLLLAEGAIVTSAIVGDLDAAAKARAAAARIVD
ncbi:TetR/AcrR family transcriptional regulator [Actinophytocola oryzae]|uniref:TetR family transcriptional regulator n=1 Tax=Actinophytocola oryzae TaxID=502181 RepID=A0A4R7VW88_9PSEU|nr:TetR/AcrR family transcriptional regulator [Actinophytocola oryzae]TDV53908.1 TetR family transcriptional regulator [Actinophytocola oryzae]